MSLIECYRCGEKYNSDNEPKGLPKNQHYCPDCWREILTQTDPKEKKVQYLLDELLTFKKVTIGELKDLIEASLRSAYSAGAYNAAKEIRNLFSKNEKV